MQDDLLLGGGIPSMGPKTDPRNYETVKCDKCGSIQFVPQYVLKRVSGMELGQGTKPVLVPLNIFACAKCGTILEDDIKGYKLENDLKEDKVEQASETKSNLIL